MVLAELASGVALGLECGSNCCCFVGYSNVCARLTDRRETGAEGNFASDEGRPTCSAARLRIVVREHHAPGCQSVEIGRLPRHDASMVRADIEPAHVISHDDQDI